MATDVRSVGSSPSIISGNDTTKGFERRDRLNDVSAMRNFSSVCSSIWIAATTILRPTPVATSRNLPHSEKPNHRRKNGTVAIGGIARSDNAAGIIKRRVLSQVVIHSASATPPIVPAMVPMTTRAAVAVICK